MKKEDEIYRKMDGDFNAIIDRMSFLLRLEKVVKRPGVHPTRSIALERMMYASSLLPESDACASNIRCHPVIPDKYNEIDDAILPSILIIGNTQQGAIGLAHYFVNYLLEPTVREWVASLKTRNGDDDLDETNKIDRSNNGDFCKNETGDTAVSSHCASDESVPSHNIDYAIRDEACHAGHDTIILTRVLGLYLAISPHDPVLAEEIAVEGGHVLLSQILRSCDDHIVVEKNRYLIDCQNETHTTTLLQKGDAYSEDAIDEIRNIGCEIVSQCRGSFPKCRQSPLTREEVRRRLPIVFNFNDAVMRNINERHPCSLRPSRETIVAAAKPNLERAQEEGMTPLSSSTLTILINQVPSRQTAQEDVGFVMWPSAVILASFITASPHLVYNKRVLELGAGCGLVGLVAHHLGARMTILTDFNDDVLNNLIYNSALNIVGAHFNNDVNYPREHTAMIGHSNRSYYGQECAEIDNKKSLQQKVYTAKLDFYAQNGQSRDTEGWLNESTGERNDPVDVILAADIICQTSDAYAVANTMHDCLQPGGLGLMVCADAVHRFGVNEFLRACDRCDETDDMLEGRLSSTLPNTRRTLHVSSINVEDVCCGSLIKVEELKKTSGYVEGMSFTLFQVQKGC